MSEPPLGPPKVSKQGWLRCFWVDPKYLVALDWTCSKLKSFRLIHETPYYKTDSTVLGNSLSRVLKHIFLKYENPEHPLGTLDCRQGYEWAGVLSWVSRVFTDCPGRQNRQNQPISRVMRPGEGNGQQIGRIEAVRTTSTLNKKLVGVSHMGIKGGSSLVNRLVD